MCSGGEGGRIVGMDRVFIDFLLRDFFNLSTHYSILGCWNPVQVETLNKSLINPITLSKSCTSNFLLVIFFFSVGAPPRRVSPPSHASS